jgi:hypothetical protein
MRKNRQTINHCQVYDAFGCIRVSCVSRILQGDTLSHRISLRLSCGGLYPSWKFLLFRFPFSPIIFLTVFPVGVLGRSYTSLISLGLANLPILFSIHCIISRLNQIMPSLFLVHFSYSFFRITCATIYCPFCLSGTPIASRHIVSLTDGADALRFLREKK